MSERRPDLIRELNAASSDTREPPRIEWSKVTMDSAEQLAVSVPDEPTASDDLFQMTLSAYGRLMYDRGTVGDPLHRIPTYDDVLKIFRSALRERDEARRIGGSMASAGAGVLNGQPLQQSLGEAILAWDSLFPETRKDRGVLTNGQS